jgi:hypothetical protein
MPYSKSQRPCRLCGSDTRVPSRVCWNCHYSVYDAEAAETGLPVSPPADRWHLWAQVIGRHIVRRCTADRTRSGLAPIKEAKTVVVEFEHPDAGSKFMTLTAAVFDEITLSELRRRSGLGPPVTGEQVRVHDGRRLFSEETTKALLAEHSGLTDH